MGMPLNVESMQKILKKTLDPLQESLIVYIYLVVLAYVLIQLFIKVIKFHHIMIP